MEEIVTESIITESTQKQRIESLESEEKENDNVNNLLGMVADIKHNQNS